VWYTELKRGSGSGEGDGLFQERVLSVDRAKEGRSGQQTLDVQEREQRYVLERGGWNHDLGKRYEGGEMR
jgi:hypothetical protein